MGLRYSLVIATSLAFAVAGDAQAGQALDAGLYAIYVPSNGTQLQLSICGRVGTSSGCFGGMFFSPFEHICAVMEGAPKTQGQVMTRDFYILDSRNSDQDPPRLYVYTRTDTFSDNGDTIGLEPKKTVTLHFKGGSGAKCQLVGSNTSIYASATGATTFDKIDRKKLKATSDGNAAVLSFSADGRGFIALSFVNGTVALDPDDVIQNGGGSGSQYLVSTHQGAPF